LGRQLRIEYPGAYYHVTARGNERKDIFKSERDREKFLSYLESAVDRYDAVVHVWCLMKNHYHLLMETPSGNLSQIMQHINGAYTNYFNTKRKRSGHLFQGRYKAILVEVDEYALELSRYIHLNPVRVGAVSDPADYRWSSFPEYSGKREAPEWLGTNFLLDYFDKSIAAARKKYSRFVTEQVGKEYESPLKQIVGGTILGSEGFAATIQERYVDVARVDRNLPALRQFRSMPTIDQIIETVETEIGPSRNISKKVAIHLCHRHSGAKLKEIGERFEIKESAVTQASRRLAEELERDKRLSATVLKIREKLNL